VQIKGELGRPLPTLHRPLRDVTVVERARLTLFRYIETRCMADLLGPEGVCR
jgi:hypothetical protein